MAEETPRTGGEASAPPEPSTEAGRPEKPVRRGLWAWALVALCAAFVAVQVVGILSRDRLERRRLALKAAPTAPAPAAPESREPTPSADSRFGPDVKEVVVAGAGTAAPAAPAEPSAPPSPPVPTEPSLPAPPKAPSQTPKPSPAAAKAPPAAPATAAAAAKARPANRALLVDVFLSQRYLRETEARLDALQIPHLRAEIRRSGRGFRVALASGDEAVRKAARRVLGAAGMLYRNTSDGVEVFVYYRDEAQPLADALGKVGAAASVTAVDGARPFWKLFAGPFAEDEARRVQKLLAAKGLSTTLEPKP